MTSLSMYSTEYLSSSRSRITHSFSTILLKAEDVHMRVDRDASLCESRSFL